MYITLLNQGNPHSLCPTLPAAFPKLPDLDSLHNQFDRISENLVCQEPLFPVPSSPLGHWKAPFSRLTEAELPNQYQVIGYKSMNRKISSTALRSPPTVAPSRSSAYQKTRHKLTKEGHLRFFNKAQMLVQCPSIVSWCGFVRTGIKLDTYSLPLSLVSLPAWASLHSSGWALSHQTPLHHTFTPTPRWFIISLNSPKISWNYCRYFHFKSKSYFFLNVALHGIENYREKHSQIQCDLS